MQSKSTHSSSDLPLLYDLVPNLPARLLFASDSLGWESIVVREYQLAPFSGTPFEYSENIIAIQLHGHLRLTRHMDGKKEQGSGYAGNVCLQAKGVPAQYAWTNPTSVQHIHLLPSFFEGIVAEVSRAEPARTEIKGSFNFCDPLIYQIGLSLSSALQTEKQIGGLYAESLAQTLVLHLLRNYSSLSTINVSQTGRLSAEQIRRVRDYIHDHLDQQITLSALAATVGLSKSRFIFLFRESVHITPHQYVIKIRVEEAQRLLMQGKLTIAQVAQQVGFVDQSHMTRHFKRALGLTPKVVLADAKNLQGASS